MAQVSRPVQRSGRFAGKPYKLSQRAYADQFGVSLPTVKRWWKRGLPCDDVDAMGEYLSPAGRKKSDPLFEEDPPPTFGVPPEPDEEPPRPTRQLGESFLAGDGLVAAIGRIKQLEVALADKLRDVINAPKLQAQELRNRLSEWASVIEAMRKVEKDAPGILSSNEKTIAIDEVEQGVTKLLLTIVNRLAMLPLRAMQTLAGFTDPHEIREELEKEIALAMEPILEMEWLPAEHKAELAQRVESATAAVDKRAAAQDAAAAEAR